MSWLKKVQNYDDHKKKHFAFFSSLVITFLILIVYILAFLPVQLDTTNNIAKKNKQSPFALVANQIQVLFGKE